MQSLHSPGRAQLATAGSVMHLPPAILNPAKHLPHSFSFRRSLVSLR